MGWLFYKAGGGSVASFGFYATVMAVIFFVKTLVMVGAAFVVAPMAGVSFGPIWTAILKLAALSMAPDVFATIVESMIGGGGGILASSLALGLYWVLMSILFDFDAAEAWMVVVYFGVLRFLLQTVVTMIMLCAIFSGSDGLAGLASGAASTASGSASTLDAKVAEWEETGNLMPAAEVFDKGKLGAMQPFVTGFKTAGAKSVHFYVRRDFQNKLDVGTLVVEWPRDAAARKTLLAALEAYRAEHTLSDDPIVDDGGRYVDVSHAWFGERPDRKKTSAASPTLTDAADEDDVDADDDTD